MRSILQLGTVVVSATFALFSAQSQAALFSTENCTTDSVSITSISETVSGDSVYSAPPAIDATGCAGLFPGTNDDSFGASEPSPNIGELGDGFLNGQPVIGGSFDPLTFITESELQDRDGDGDATDPGWVHLAHVDGDDSSISYSTMGEGADSLYLGDILEFVFCDSGPDCSQTGGTWSLEVAEDSFDLVTAILGPNTFDHLTFVFKSGLGGVGVYDFNFKQLVTEGTVGINFTTAYTFTGTWNMDDFLSPGGNPQDYSHMSIWARDPALQPPGLQVPLPGSIWLLLMGALSLTLHRLTGSRRA